MVIITDAHGNIQSPTITENVYQGSNLANEIVFLAPLPQSNSVSISFRKPNGVLTEPHLMTPYTDVPSEYDLSGWVYSLPSEITELYGQVTFQIKVYNTIQTIATVGGTFQVIRGVPILPTTPSTSTFEEILAYLSGMQGDMENGWLVSKGILPYDATFTYPYGVNVYDKTTNSIYTSKVANNVGHALSDTTYWERNILVTEQYLQEQMQQVIAKGLLGYDEEFSYPLGALVYDGYTNSFYKSIVNNNIGNALNNTTYWQNIGLETISNKSTTINASSTDIQYPSAKAVYTALQGKQDTLSTAQQNAVNSGITTSLVAQITTNQNDIATINGKIPTQASSSNQLADKDFVNSSISTNTANFIGTFASISDLLDYSGTITNNDYANVINSVVTDNGNDWATVTELNNYDKTLLTNYDYAWVINNSKFDLYRFDIVNQVWELRATHIAKTDVSLIVAYNRYAYNGTTTQWTWNYTVNTSGFTAVQWAAINSGITDTLVTKLQGVEEGAEVNNVNDVQIDGSSVVSSKVAQISTINSNYNASSNKLATASDISGMQTTNNLVTSLSVSSTDTQYPSAKCVYDLVGDINSALTTLNSGSGV